MSESRKEIEDFVRPELAGFVGYAACKSPDAFSGRVVKLDANENNYGASPRVREALARFDGYHIYPDAVQSGLRQELADYTGVSANNIVAGSGSDQLIDLLIRLFCAPGEEIINLPPTFAMFSFYASLQGVRVVSVPLTDYSRFGVFCSKFTGEAGEDLTPPARTHEREAPCRNEGRNI